MSTVAATFLISCVSSGPPATVPFASRHPTQLNHPDPRPTPRWCDSAALAELAVGLPGLTELDLGDSQARRPGLGTCLGGGGGGYGLWGLLVWAG